jgi:hypothetical protein
MEAHLHPERASTLGILWLTDTKWAGNSTIIAKRCGVSQNTLCFDFRCHGFTTETSVPYSSQIGELGRPLYVRVHSHPMISRQTLAQGVFWVGYIRPPGKQRRRKLRAMLNEPLRVQKAGDSQMEDSMFGAEMVGNFRGDMVLPGQEDDLNFYRGYEIVFLIVVCNSMRK